MKRFEVVACKGKEVIYKNCKDNEIDAVILEWELRLKGYDTKLITTEW